MDDRTNWAKNAKLHETARKFVKVFSKKANLPLLTDCGLCYIWLCGLGSVSFLGDSLQKTNKNTIRSCGHGREKKKGDAISAELELGQSLAKKNMENIKFGYLWIQL